MASHIILTVVIIVLGMALNDVVDMVGTKHFRIQIPELNANHLLTSPTGSIVYTVSLKRLILAYSSF